MNHRLVGEQRAVLAPLFAANRPSYLLDAILEGKMGEAYVDVVSKPSSAMLRLGELAFFGGAPTDPVAHIWLASLGPVVGVWPPNPAWLPRLEKVPSHRLVHQERWSLSSDSLDCSHLSVLTQALTAEFDLVPIDLDLAKRIPSALDTSNQINNYGSPEAFAANGFGLALLHDDRIIAAVSTFAICSQGAEIQINVRPDNRRQGLATGLAAQFILDCLDRGLDPHWDAGNPLSRALALKLGYSTPTRYSMPILVPEEG